MSNNGMLVLPIGLGDGQQFLGGLIRVRNISVSVNLSRKKIHQIKSNAKSTSRQKLRLNRASYIQISYVWDLLKSNHLRVAVKYIKLTFSLSIDITLPVKLTFS